MQGVVDCVDSQATIVHMENQANRRVDDVVYCASPRTYHYRSNNIATPFVFTLVVHAVFCTLLYAQPIPQETAKSESVVIDFPDRVDLQVMVDYVGKTLDVRFIYGEELKSQLVDLRPTPVTIPKSKLLNLLVSLLRVRDLVLVEQTDGFYRIVRTDQSASSVSYILPGDTPPDQQSMRMVTQVMAIPSGDVKGIAAKLAPFLSASKSGLVSLPKSGSIIITDYESRIALIREFIKILDAGVQNVEVRSIPIPGADPNGLATQITSILSESHRLRNRSGSPPAVRGDVFPGMIVVVGTHDQIDEAVALIQQFAPSEIELSTKSYSPRFISVDRVKQLIEHVVLAPGSGIAAPVSLYEDAPSGRLFVTAERRTHEAIAQTLLREDQTQPRTQRPMRVYRPKHRKATELLATISQLMGQSAETTHEPIASKSDLTSNANTRSRTQVPPLPPAQTSETVNAAPSGSGMRVQGPDYILTADEHTNSILAIGTREFHAQLDLLIEDLDKRRPQVLIGMTLVAITMSDSLDFGVELADSDLGDAWDFLVFSNFGLSSIDAVTGQRVLAPGLGGNGILLGPNEVPIVLKALASKAQARVISTPRILVSDNARGTLKNVDEAPFTSVNASDTVATTSFAGFESAGTTLTVTPHISQPAGDEAVGDYLTLDYELTFSNFSGSSQSATVPPPRTTNSFTSTVEIPDGYTLITGGLIVENKSESVSMIPILGELPGIGFLFRSSSRQNTKTKIFAFIRPTILRDDEFEDLKYITLKDIESAGIETDQDNTQGEPLWMR